jgi:hypothetical protein
MKRKPSCLISNAHCGPVGTMRLTVGKQGSMKPGGRRDIPKLNHSADGGRNSSTEETLICINVRTGGDRHKS